MVESMVKLLWEKTKAFVVFVYNWITVLAGSLIGVDTALDLLGQFQVIDYSPFLGPQKAAGIVSAIAVLKGVAAMVQAFLAAKRKELEK